MRPAASDAPGSQDLFDGLEQPVAVFEHDAVELVPLVFVHRARLQRFQIKPDGSDGVFSSWVTALMKASCCSLRRISRTRKMVFSTTPPMMISQQQNAEEQQNAGAPVEQHPADVERRMTEIRPTPSAMKNAIDFLTPACDDHDPAYASA